jgi:hypothetical protein
VRGPPTSESGDGQVIFERHLRNELSLVEAADALVALVRDRQASGGSLKFSMMAEGGGRPGYDGHRQPAILS